MSSIATVTTTFDGSSPQANPVVLSSTGYEHVARRKVAVYLCRQARRRLRRGCCPSTSGGDE